MGTRLSHTELMLRSSKPRVGDFFEMLVSLRHVEPLIWRKLRVPAEIDLEDLHEVLQLTFGWKSKHRHAYQVGEYTFRPYEEAAHDTTFYIDETAAALGAIACEGATFTYEYDFGDGWNHDVRVERLIPGDQVGFDQAIECLAGQRACPPEDCGGPPGYEQLLSVLANPSDPDYRSLKSWVGRSFDAEAFELEKVNKKLATLSRRLGFGQSHLGKSGGVLKH